MSTDRQPIRPPCLMMQNYSVPVLVLERGWFDHGYGPGPLGVDYACLADLGHVVEPRVLRHEQLSTFEEAAEVHNRRAMEALERAVRERSKATQEANEVQRIRRYALRNGCDW